MSSPKDPIKRNEWIEKNRLAHIGKTNRHDWIEKECKFCNKKFKIPLWKHKVGKGKFCSKKCYTENNRNFIIKKCENCGNEFKSYNSQKRKFCSIKCKHNSGREERRCSVCNKTFIFRKSIPKKTCSKKCEYSLKRGSNGGMWKGDEASYSAFHYRVESVRGKPKKCEVCGQDNPNKKYEWANLTGNYKDVDDYKRMCTSCHRCFDNRTRNKNEN